MDITCVDIIAPVSLAWWSVFLFLDVPTRNLRIILPTDRPNIILLTTSTTNNYVTFALGGNNFQIAPFWYFYYQLRIHSATQTRNHIRIANYIWAGLLFWKSTSSKPLWNSHYKTFLSKNVILTKLWSLDFILKLLATKR